ncbi:uncharacterized protein [Onthophagus taurus]|uniref:uncharacterized protein n=1 Tax=Onthophagus taurus TaxID=166361 RepID=UPI000C2041D1|nr:uncharacterized protein LOC111417106 [Onthophagus taurus]
MKTLGEFLGMSKQNEMLLLTLLGICFTIFDPAVLNLHANLQKVWSVHMDPTKFTLTVQLYVKYIISSIVLVKTFTVHIYLAFYIVMLWPAVFEERPGLLIPWLIVSTIKCLLMGVMSLLTGLYICVVYKFSKAACWDFLLTQIIDHGPSLYTWLCVLSYYKHLKLISSLKIYPPRRSTPSTLFDLTGRRRRVKGLVLDLNLNSLNDDRQLLSTSTFDDLFHQLNVGAKCTPSRSLDSLLTKITADVKKEEFFKIAEEELDEDETLSIKDRALKSLNVSESYMKHKEELKKNKIEEQKPDSFSETELKSIFLDVDVKNNTTPKNDKTTPPKEINKEKNSPKVSKLPRRSKTIGTSYTLFGTHEKLVGCDTPKFERSKTNAGFNTFYINPQTTKAASVSKAVTANRPVMQKSKSCIPKSDFYCSKLPQVVHATFKQDGYTLAYLEKAKYDAIQRVRKEEIVSSESKENVGQKIN